MDSNLQALLATKPRSLDELLLQLTPEIYANLKTAIELGKWADGARLEQEQLENCLQLLILYEAREVPEESRTGIQLNSCNSEQEAAVAIEIKNSQGHTEP